jgi:hypothetical protein
MQVCLMISLSHLVCHVYCVEQCWHAVVGEAEFFAAHTPRLLLLLLLAT